MALQSFGEGLRIENFEVTTGTTFIGRIQSNDRTILWVETGAESRMP
jgi:hypothetical protein